ncbi:transposase [Wukongibacter sp. M2B1]|uniref:transposase n=1 Tax=Wukongibacter sp. M2B1 TaxID=3088895 RepID=UPI003D794B49
MPIQAKQLNFRDVSSDFDDFFNQNQCNLLSLLNEFINISDFIPFSFYQKYYSKLGTNRDFSLESMLLAFILKNILSIPTIDLLISLLNISSEMRSFCGFLRVPHKSQFSRFKSNFSDELRDLFHNLVDITENLANEVNPFLSSILITDTTGFELYVTENNPKFYQSQLRKAKAYAKTLKKDNKDLTFDIEKYAQSRMPKYASSNNDAKLSYLNGHFGYFLKSTISTNGFGLVRDVNFYDSDNNLSLDLTPRETKDLYDAKSLIPTLETFFSFHPDFKYKYFIGDAGFDADDNYAYLHGKNIMPIISLNPRNSSDLPQSDFNEIGIPLCPFDPSLPMVYDGISREKGRADRVKYICPKVNKTVIKGKTTYILNCHNPCTKSKCGRIKQLTIHHNYRFNTSFPRNSLKWILLFKLRTIVERSISQIKNLLQIKASKVRSTVSLKADIFLACISQLIAFILLAKSQDKHNNPLAIKSLIA